LLDQVWLWFRGLPFWAQAAGWILGFWLLAPLLVWRSSWSPGWKAGLTATFILFLVVAVAVDEQPPAPAAAADVAVPSEDEPSPGDEAESAGSPSERNADPEGDDDGRSGPVDPQPDPQPKRKPTILVSRVIDGDTIEVQLRGRTEDIRLIGIDTPETVHPTVGVECFGPQASDFTKDRLEGKRVRLEYDVERRDRYGRLLAYVWIDGVMFNKTLVAQGFASVSTYPPNVRYVDRFLAAQRAARSSNKGYWAGCTADVEVPEPQEQQAPVAGGGANCDRNYSGACIPPFPPDVDCTEIGATNFRSTGSDPHDFDSDGDGVACEA